MGGEVRVDSPLDVHVFPGREPLSNGDHGGQLTAEMLGDPQRERGGTRLVGQRPGGYLEELTQAARQPSEVLAFGNGRNLGDAHPSTMPEAGAGAKAGIRREAPFG
jgi:hypothetical protein